VSAFAGTIEQVTDSLAELLKPDSVAILIELAELRVRFKPKRNFIKLLDGVVRSAAK